MTWYGDLGSLWSSSLHRKLAISPNGQSIQALRGDGRAIGFAGGGSTWVGPQDIKDSLSVVSGNYIYRDRSAQTLQVYDNGSAVAMLGQLQSITQANGLKLMAMNSTSNAAGVAPAAGYLLSLSDAFGRSLSFTYDMVIPTGGTSITVIKRITDATGRTITPVYDPATGNLMSLNWQDGNVQGFVYDSANLNQTWALTGVIDENAKRYATFTYDPTGWAKSTQLNGGCMPSRPATVQPLSR